MSVSVRDLASSRLRLAVPGLLAVILGPGAGREAAAASQAPPSATECLACHAEPSLTGTSGRPVAVDPSGYDQSVHGQAGVGCTDCHAELSSTREWPHPAPLAPARCEPCHEDTVAAYRRGVHARARERAADSPAPRCADCHGTHDIRSAADPASLTFPSKLPSTCGRCHGDPDVIRRGQIEIGDVFNPYRDSIHGRAVTEAGLIVAATCSHCHGSHDIRRRIDEASPVNRRNIAATCGRCHVGIAAQYDQGIHGRAGRSGQQAAPVCSDCHTAHHIQRVDAPAWQLEAIRECGSCHRSQIATYRDTFHGQVTALGFARTATCADCHGAHEIYPNDDPRSTVAGDRRVATCRTCHPAATARFAQYDPHADRHNRARNPTLYYAGLIMDGLLVGVFVFWGAHLVLWLPRGLAARRAGAARRDADAAERVSEESGTEEPAPEDQGPAEEDE